MNADWIADQKSLEKLCDHLHAQPYIAVDTEFHRERTYYAQLALIQVASMTEMACIDPLADIDLTPFDEVMNNPRVLKVFHAGRQDLEIFFDRTGRVPAPLFDTQIAAALLGRGDQLAYRVLVRQVTGRNLKKAHRRTNWMRRPLDRDVLAYAIGDVDYLRDVFEELEAELERLGRARWLDEEQAHLLETDTYAVPLNEVWRRVKGSGRLKGVECEVARRLARFREEEARRVDRPRNRVLTDEVIVELSRHQPRSIDKLKTLRALDGGIRKRYGEQLLSIVEAAVASPKSTWPSTPRRKRRPSIDPALVSALNAVLTARANEENITPRTLASKSQLERLAGGDRDVPVMKGWRRELAGVTLARFLDGQLQLKANRGQLVVAGHQTGS